MQVYGLPCHCTETGDALTPKEVFGMKGHVEVKNHYSATELASMQLSGMPATRENVRQRAERESWSFVEVKGRGGVRREYVPPADVMEAIRNRVAQTMLAQSDIKVPAVTRHDRKTLHREEQLDLVLATVENLTTSQRDVAEARCAVVSEVLKIATVIGKKKATIYFAKEAADKRLPDLMQQLVERANAKGNDERSVSSRTLFRWCEAFESTNSPRERLRRLAPQVRQGDMNLPYWMGDFLAAYRRPNKPPLAEAYREFTQHFSVNETVPSIDAVRRALKKLPPVMLYQGRHTGAALKAKLPFVRRDWSKLEPNDVWVGDGHGMKCKVINPDTGLPQQMEVTLMLDCASRRAMGWSVSLSENVLAVSDALRHGVSRNPLPLIYYSDNGAGETGKVLDAPLTGILPRLGIHHETGIPGNPQGRGLIERAWQTITIPLARKYATFQGSTVDRDTLRLVNRDINRALTVAKNAPEGVTVAIPHVPSFEEFIADLDAAIAEYNDSPHSSLPKRGGLHLTPNEFYQAHISPDALPLSAIELQDLFRPTFIRMAKRGEVRLWNNIYFSRELMDVDGQEVQVGVDIHDPANVIIRNLEGRFVCVAEINGNSRAAFPVSMVEKLREDRVKGQVKRAQDKIDAANATLRPALVMAEGEVLPGITGQQIAGAFERLTIDAEQEERPVLVAVNPVSENGEFVVPEMPRERLELHKKLTARRNAGGQLSERESKWISRYELSDEFRLMNQRYADADQASA